MNDNEYQLFKDENGQLSFWPKDNSVLINSVEYIVKLCSVNRYDHECSVFLELEPNDILVLKDGKFRLDENLALNWM